MSTEIRKTLSANDVGETGGHQAGILVPKEPGVLEFFPVLDRSTKNPRMTLIMRERHNGARWNFNFIYYNGRLFGGTRNEYRLTCMTAYLRSVNAKPMDELVFAKDDNLSFEVTINRAKDLVREPDDGVLVLSGGWKRIDY